VVACVSGVLVYDVSRLEDPFRSDIASHRARGGERCLPYDSTTRTGRRIAYVYFENELGRRAAANLMTKDEAHHFKPAKLTKLLRKPKG